MVRLKDKRHGGFYVLLRTVNPIGVKAQYVVAKHIKFYEDGKVTWAHGSYFNADNLPNKEDDLLAEEAFGMAMRYLREKCAPDD
jgi:hypothetical protein